MKNKTFFKEGITFLILLLSPFVFSIEGKAKETELDDSHNAPPRFHLMSSSKTERHKDLIASSTRLYRSTYHIETKEFLDLIVSSTRLYRSTYYIETETFLDVTTLCFLVRDDQSLTRCPLANPYMIMTGKPPSLFLEDQNSQDIYVPMGQENDSFIKSLSTTEQAPKSHYSSIDSPPMLGEENFYDSIRSLSIMGDTTPYTSIASIPSAAHQEKRFSFSRLKLSFNNLKFFHFFFCKKHHFLKNLKKVSGLGLSH